MRLTPLLSAVCTVALLAGCASTPKVPDLGPQLADFQALPEEPRVRFEPGAEAAARRVAELLPQAVARIEARHYLPFSGPVEVYVCGSEACFARYVPQPPNLTAAVAFDNRLLLAGRLFTREPQRLEPILLHELSHLHLGQRLGHYTPGIPVWFHEGLASSVADGGGADLVSTEAALAALREGRQFRPDADLGGLPRRYAGDWGLDMGTFYRQALLFVDWLRSRGEARFRRFLLELQDAEQFAPAFGHAYDESVAHAAAAFADQVLQTAALPAPCQASSASASMASPPCALAAHSRTGAPASPGLPLTVNGAPSNSGDSAR